jgi:hypothetical protein
MQEEKMLYRFLTENTIKPIDGWLMIEGENVNNQISYILSFVTSLECSITCDDYYYKYNNDVVLGRFLDVRRKGDIVLATNHQNHLNYILIHLIY